MNRLKTHYPLIFKLFIAFVFIQSLFFKFTAAPESIFIFQTIADWSGIALFEPEGRLLVGTLELVASVLLFIPAFSVYGALLALGIMTGAIFFHLFTPLGIVVFDDGGTLFAMACVVFLFSLTLVLREKHKLPIIGKCSRSSGDSTPPATGPVA